MQRSIIVNPGFFKLCIFVMLSIAAIRVADAAEIVVITNPAVIISADEITDIYTGEKQFAGSIRLVPVDNAVLQDGFLSRFLGMDVVKYNRIWTRKLFRDGIPQPTMKSGDAEVISFVKRTPGAIGYVSTTPAGVKVIRKPE